MVRAAMFASCFAISLTAQQSEHTAGSPRAVSYDRDVRPILADRCFACHGPDETSRKADLRLDLSEHATALRKHAAAIVARDANASEAWRRITSEDDDDRMPPKSSGKPPLSQREREIVRAWIEQGAVYEPHWSFVPPTRPATPVETPNAIDAFVRAELRTHQLQPSERAAPEIQLRRLFLALTGLPPEPGDIAAFCKDPSDTAYAQWITRIFTEEPWRSRYAERMATPWLDSARYADTSGIHMDAGRQIWPFRDWVLEAYRSNMPFDAFVRDQIAGDLWPDATVTQKVASGFHRCHVTTDEGGAIDAEYLVEYAVDRVATTGSVFLGLTLGCARCHDHKYDPISQEDFYGLYAYFASIEEPGLYSQIPDANRALEPFLRVPSDAQLQQEDALKSDLAAVQLELDSVPAEEAAEFARWRSELLQEARVQWPASQVTAAQSQGGADLSIDADGTVTASGKNPDQDVHVLTLRTDATSLRMLHLMALPAPDRQDQRVGRAENGNAVLQSIEVDAVSVRDPQQKRRLSFTWAWADVEQGNGNFHVVNAIASDDGVGWAVDAHMRAGGSREALFVTDEPFGFDGGTELQVTLRYDSVYQRHSFARVRVQLGQIDEQALERLPEASGGFHVAGPFVGDAEENWSAAFGPETALVLDKGAQFLSSKGKSGKPLTWRHREGLREDAVGALPAGANATFVARTLWAPTARKRTFSLGSDDGFRLYASGKEVAQNRIDRGAQKDQDSAEIELTRGPQLLTMRIVNTGGEGGFYQRSQPRYGELTGELVAALLPSTAADADQRLRTAWRRSFSKSYLASLEKKNTLSQQLRELDTKMPRTMVMKEREQRRPTYVLARGQYDQPIKDREIPRTTPKALGTLPEGAPDDRRGLAQWITSKDNPLFARVQANRLFELMFGAGIVRTSEDFGMQGEWPSHMDLLDWLAVEFRECGYDAQHMLRLIATSETFRQDDRASEAAMQVDADNRLLSWFPRRRLSAEQLRDQALFVSGLLVERFGGPSVKPYQPQGLWQEVAMLQSNTREFVQGSGDALFRRSLYTYHKRACPPPSMQTFDQPTREACVIRRAQTNTPMQALVLWNDEQFVEAARMLAVRAFREAQDDAGRIESIFVRCTGRKPSSNALARATEALAAFRARYMTDPESSKQALAVGSIAPPADIAQEQLAPLSLLASTILNLDATVCIP